MDQRLSSVRIIGWDVETFKIAPGNVTPQLVCVTTYEGPGTEQIYLDEEGLVVMRRYLLDPEVHLVAHNTVFDLAVLCVEDPSFIPLVFKAIEEGRIHCTMLRCMVIDNAFGELKFAWDEIEECWIKPKFALQDLCWRYFRERLKKGEDTWQLKFGQLYRVPLFDWPPEATHYAIYDAVKARDCFFHQYNLIGEDIPHWWRIQAAAWALYLASVWGFRTDKEPTLKLEQEIIDAMNRFKAIAQEYGFIRTGRKESKNKKAIQATVAELIEKPELTAKGQIATTREQLRSVPCSACGGDFDSHQDGKENEHCSGQGHHRGVWAVSEYGREEKRLTTYIKVLKQGFYLPVQCRYNAIIETFRTSCSKPNIQNYPRKGGLRDCIIPREGNVFAFCDYDTLEMRTLAQVCVDWFGFSDIGEAINLGQDVHVALAAELRSEPYERTLELYLAGDPEVAVERQAGKNAMYGLSGGMGPHTFVEYAKTVSGLVISLGKATECYYSFRNRWREMPKYFDRCSSFIEEDHSRAKSIVFERSGLVRGQVNYTAICNGFFQHLAAMGAKDALYQTSKECFVVEDSPLYGCRPWGFLHDEIAIEIPYLAFGPERASAATKRLEEVMIGAMKFWVPDVNISVSGAMARRWAKGAKAVYEGEVMLPGKLDKSTRQWVPDRTAA